MSRHLRIPNNPFFAFVPFFIDQVKRVCLKYLEKARVQKLALEVLLCSPGFNAAKAPLGVYVGFSAKKICQEYQMRDTDVRQTK